MCVTFFDGMRGLLRVLLETLDINVRHCCACACSAMTIDCACFGSVLYLGAFGGYSLDEMSLAIFC